MRKYLAEFIGTFFLVATIGCVLVPTNSADKLAPLAIAGGLMVMVYACGHVSGAHFNPAVTLALFLRGRCRLLDVPGYFIAQCAAASAAAAAVIYLKGHPATPIQFDGPTVKIAGLLIHTRPLLAELLYTFALCYVVLNVATARGTAGNSFYGLAIGFTVLAGAYSVGSISGGAFNPAVVLGGIIMGLFSLINVWVYLAAQFVASIVAAILFSIVNPGDP